MDFLYLRYVTKTHSMIDKQQLLRKAQMMSLSEKDQEIVRLHGIIKELTQELETTQNERDEYKRFLASTIQWMRGTPKNKN